MEFEGYCVKCREKRSVDNGEVKDTPNGRQMAQGKCPVCGTTVTRFMAGSGNGGGKSAEGGKAGGSAKASGAKTGEAKSGGAKSGGAKSGGAKSGGAKASSEGKGKATESSGKSSRSSK